MTYTTAWLRFFWKIANCHNCNQRRKRCRMCSSILNRAIYVLSGYSCQNFMQSLMAKYSLKNQCSGSMHVGESSSPIVLLIVGSACPANRFNCECYRSWRSTLSSDAFQRASWKSIRVDLFTAHGPCTYVHSVSLSRSPITNHSHSRSLDQRCKKR